MDIDDNEGDNTKDGGGDMISEDNERLQRIRADLVSLTGRFLFLLKLGRNGDIELKNSSQN